MFIDTFGLSTQDRYYCPVTNNEIYLDEQRASLANPRVGRNLDDDCSQNRPDFLAAASLLFLSLSRSLTGSIRRE